MNKLHRSRHRRLLWPLLAALILLAAGCNGQITPEILRTCERGQKIPGSCENPRGGCHSHQDCLIGYYCDSSDNKCKISTPCTGADDTTSCGRGRCEAVKNGYKTEWLCMNPDSCTAGDPLDACIPSDYCSPQGKCEIPDTRCDESCKDHHGICTKNGCEDITPCGKDDSKCLVGKICTKDGCVEDSDAAACPSTSASPRGFCDRFERVYKNKPTCSVLTDCIEGFHCDGGGCVADKCKTDEDCTKIGSKGVCTDGVCKNSQNCQSDDDCLSPNVCVEDPKTKKHQCIPKEKRCGENGCPGRQVCKQSGLSYSCQSSPTCDTSDDCIDGFYCPAVGGLCEDEHNVTCSSSTFSNKSYNSPVEHTLCGGQEDSYEYIKTNPLSALTYIEVSLVGPNVGKGPVTIDVYDKQDPNIRLEPKFDKIISVSPGKTVRSILIEKPKTAELIVKVHAGNKKIGNGLTYGLNIYDINDEDLLSCESNLLSLPTPNGSESNTTRANTQPEVIYKLEVTTPTVYKVTLNSIDHTSDGKLKLSVISGECYSKDEFFSKVAKSEIGGVEFNDLLNPGTYYFKVSAPGNKGLKAFQIRVDSHAPECELNDMTCTSDTLSYCSSDYKRETRPCSLCKGNHCVDDEGKGCSAPIEVNSVNIAQFKNKTYSLGNMQIGQSWRKFKSLNADCSLANNRKIVDSKDLTFHITIPPGEAFNGVLTGSYGQNTVAFLVQDDGKCDTGACLKSIDGDTSTYGDTENIYLKNPSTTDDLKVFLVVKNVTTYSTLDDLKVEFFLGKETCIANQKTCFNHRELRTCNPFGNAYSELLTCPPNSGCIDAKNGVPAHCAIAKGDLCSNPIEVKDGTKLSGETFKFTSSDSDKTYTTASRLDACKQQVFIYQLPSTLRDNVYKIDKKDVNVGDKVQFTLSPEAKKTDFLVWASASPCPDPLQSSSSIACLAAVDTYSNRPYALEQPEVLEFVVDKKQDYYIFVVDKNNSNTTNIYDDQAHKDSSYAVSVKIKKASKNECDPTKYQTLCDPASSTITACSVNGFKYTLTCANGCDTTNLWCKSDSTLKLPNGETCEYPHVVDMTYGYGILNGSVDTYAYSGNRSPSYEKKGYINNQCYVPSDTVTTLRHVYAFHLKTGETLSVENTIENSELSVSLLEDCFSKSSCQSYHHAEGLYNLSYTAKKDGYVYLLVEANHFSGSAFGPYAFQWKVSKENDCSFDFSHCSNDQVIQCIGAGTSSATLNCPDIGTKKTTCNGASCNLGKDYYSSYSSCSSPLSLGSGSTFFVDPQDIYDLSADHKLTPTKLAANNCSISGINTALNVYKIFYSVTLGANQHIHAEVRSPDGSATTTSTSLKYGLYVVDSGNCQLCKEPGTASFDVTERKGYPSLDYHTSPGTYTVALVVDDKDAKPAIVSIFAEDDAETSCTEGDRACVSDSAGSYLKQCVDHRWQRVFSCKQSCDTSGKVCEGPQNAPEGDRPETAVTLTGNSGTVDVDLTYYRNTTPLLKHQNDLYGDCIFLNNGKVNFANGPDKYFKIHLNAGDLFTASLSSDSLRGLSLYLLDTDQQTCVTYDPTDYTFSPPPFKRDVYFKAAKTGDYLLVVDAQQSSKKYVSFQNEAIQLKYSVNRSEGPANDWLLSHCQDSNTLVTWSPMVDRSSTAPFNWKKHSVTCPDGCLGSACVTGPKTNTLAAVQSQAAIAPPFVAAVDFSSKQLSDQLTIDPSCWKYGIRSTSSYRNVSGGAKDAFFKISLEPLQRLQVYSIFAEKRDFFYTAPALPFYYLFSNAANATDASKSCLYAAAVEQSDAYSYYLPFAPLDSSYQAGLSKEDLFIGFDTRRLPDKSHPPYAIYYVDVVNPECLPTTYSNTCGTDHKLTICNRKGVVEEYQCKDASGADQDCSGSTNGSCPTHSGRDCADAIPVDLTSLSSTPMTLTGTLADSVNTHAAFDTSNSPNAMVGGDIVYKVKLSANQTVHISLTSTASTKEHLALYILKDSNCYQDDIKTGMFAGPSDATNTLTYQATSNEEIFVVVDSQTNARGTYSLEFSN